MIRIIGLHGKKQSGKDTAANYFFGNSNVYLRAFAEPLKQAAMAMFRLTYEQVYDELKKDEIDPRYGKTPRQILQWLGTDVVREMFGKDHWVNMLEEEIKKIITAKSFMQSVLSTPEEPLTIFVTDVRFENEAEMIRRLGGIVVEVRRNVVYTLVDGEVVLTPRPEGTAHVSEQSLPPYLVDHVIENHTDDKEDLFRQMRFLVASLLTI